MDASSLGSTIFTSLPSWLKGTVTFSRSSGGTYDAVTGVTTGATTVTASARCVTQPARGTQSESFLNMLSIIEKYIVITVPAVDLAGFVPQAGDIATINSAKFTVTGVETTQPDGSTPVVYRATAQR